MTEQDRFEPDLHETWVADRTDVYLTVKGWLWLHPECPET